MECEGRVTPIQASDFRRFEQLDLPYRACERWAGDIELTYSAESQLNTQETAHLIKRLHESR